MIKYTDSVEGISPEMLEGFFVGWKKPCSHKDHLAILRNSDYIVLAIDSDKDQVIGFVTALTDHLLAAFVPLLEVLPEYQRRGIGSELMSCLLDRLKHIPGVSLMCDQELQPFYSRFSMQRSVGMVIRNY